MRSYLPEATPTHRWITNKGTRLVDPDDYASPEKENAGFSTNLRFKVIFTPKIAFPLLKKLI